MSKIIPVPGQPGCFMFWALAPWLILTMVLLPLLTTLRSPGPITLMIGLELMMLMLLLVLANGDRFAWAGRVLGGLIFLSFVTYIVAQLVQSGGRVTISASRSQPSVGNAVMGLIIFGLPGLWYAIIGRLTFRSAEEETEDGEHIEFAIEEKRSSSVP